MRLQTLNSSSFNSQRDGILPNFAPFNARCRKFQFPTGWNSTVSAEHLKYTQEIRFNSQRDGILPSTFKSCFRVSARFNSQRDGILPRSRSSTKLALACFNSQRDGILPQSSAHLWLARSVSIPNGMEFYIPNPINLSKLQVGFNSQRDGILRFRTISLPCPLVTFQFPTGWNSTILISKS